MTYKRVYIMGVDGAGRFFDSTPTPNIDAIFADGAITYNMTTSRPTISAQCWGSMFHGVDADRHRLNNNIVSYNRYRNGRFPSFMKVIRDAYPDAEIASYCCWSPINYGIVEEDMGVVKVNAPDAALTEKTCEYLDGNDPKVLFVHFDSVDGMGHRHGYNTPEHLSQITAVDEMIGRIYRKAEEKGYTEDMLFIVTADHGGTPPNEYGKGSHGGDSDWEKICMLAVSGKSVKKGTIGECNIKDVASIVLAAFGLEQPDTWTSRVPEGLFTDIAGGGERPVEPGFDPPKARLHTNIATPKDSLSMIEDIVGELRAYYPFDGNMQDAKCDNHFEYDGKIYYTEGYHGSGCSLYDGCIFNSMTFDEGDATVGCWIRMWPPACNKILFRSLIRNGEGKDEGFSVTLGDDSVGIRTFDRRGKSVRGIVSYPENEYDGWFHFLFSVDREADKLAVYVDFEFVGEYSLTEGLKGAPLGLGRFESQPSGMPVSIDELIITSSAMTKDKVKALGKYYGI